jgi:hypothetical protein
LILVCLFGFPAAEVLWGKSEDVNEIKPIICGVVTALSQLALSWPVLGRYSLARSGQ